TRAARAVTSPNQAPRRTGKGVAAGQSGPKPRLPRPGISVGSQHSFCSPPPATVRYLAQHTWPSRVAQATAVQPAGRLLSGVSVRPAGGRMARTESMGVTARRAGEWEWPGNQANVVPRSPTAMLAIAAHAAMAAAAVASRCLRRILLPRPTIAGRARSAPAGPR